MNNKYTIAKVSAAALLLAATIQEASAQAFIPGDLLLSSSTYAGTASPLSVGSALPNSSGATATASSAFGPTGVFTNDAADANFGVTAPITITQITPTGNPTSTVLSLPAVDGVTSFSSKSELGLTLSTDGSSVEFMDYASTVGQLDISNSNTPAITEPGNTDTATATYRQVVQLNADGTVQTTTTNAYNGNNGRNAILDNANGLYYTVGNAGNGSGSTATTDATGAQIITPGVNATPTTPGTTQAGFFNVTQIGDAADKPAKDNNYRGLANYNGGLYVSKGSGSNGINTVYQVGTTGNIPTTTTNLPNTQAANGTINILPGFSTTTAKSSSGVEHPFGMFFANANTLYVTDEGNGSTADESSPSTSNQYAGLQKYSLNTNTNVWSLDYTLTLGLNLGSAYTVNGNGAGGNYTAYTDGLRNITGVVNANGTVTLYAITSTVDNYTNEDFGADPNELVAITDTVADTSAGQVAGEAFSTLDTAAYGQVLRGVSLTPQAAPEPSSWALAAAALGLGIYLRRRACNRSC